MVDPGGDSGPGAPLPPWPCVNSWYRLGTKRPYCPHDRTPQSKISSVITLIVRGRMHGNETDPRTDFNVHVQQHIYSGTSLLQPPIGQAFLAVTLGWLLYMGGCFTGVQVY